MATQIVPGQRSWGMTRDADGNREYRIRFLVRGLTTDGPASVLLTPGLPLPGSVWDFDGDVDAWAFCRLDATVTPLKEDKPNQLWSVEFTFSTKGDGARCKDVQIDDPLLVPPEVSGGYVRYTIEATKDRFGNPIVNSSREQYRGSRVEFDANRGQIRIRMNVASFDLVRLAYQMVDTVNDAPLWGFPARAVKLSSAPWERKYYGACYAYYVLTLEFDTGDEFDRDLLDEGSKVLRGYWDLDQGSATYGRWILSPGVTGAKASDFIAYQDWYGNLTTTLLDGQGKPAQKEFGTVAFTVISAELDASGLGYSEGDVLTVQGGSFTTPATITVLGTGAGGSIFFFQLTNPGDYQAGPPNPVSVTGGSGSGATFNLGFGTTPVRVVSAVPANAQVGAAEAGDLLTVVGGTFTSAAVIRVLTVDNLGTILTVVVEDAGSYTAPPPNDVNVTGGSGPDVALQMFTLEWGEDLADVTVGNNHVEFYHESNFLLLGIPLIL